MTSAKQYSVHAVVICHAGGYDTITMFLAHVLFQNENNLVTATTTFHVEDYF